MNKSKVISNVMIVFVLLLSNTILIGQNIPYNSPCGNSDWKIAWYDDFNTLDLNKWDVKNNFDQYAEIPSVCIDDNVIVSNGELLLSIRKESYHCPTGVGEWGCKRQWLAENEGNNDYNYKFTAGEVVSKGEYDMQYGYTEARIKFPVEKGTWSCYWLFGQSSTYDKDEIDIAEIWGTNICKTYTEWIGPLPTVHTADRISTGINLHNQGTIPVSLDHHYDLPCLTIANYHIYSVYWSPTIIKFYFDGILIRTLANNTNGIHINSRVILDAWLTDGYFNPLGNWSVSRYNSFPNITTMKVDWVRVYESRNFTAKAPYLLNSKDDLQNSGKKEITVMWELPTSTPSSTTCIFEYGPSIWYNTTTTVSSNSATDNLFSKTINNLDANTEYFYKVTAGSYIHTGSFVTPPSDASNSTSFYATGSKISINNVSSSDNNNDIADEIINDYSNSRTFLLQTNGFVTENAKEFWQSEFFKDNTRSSYLKKTLPIIGPISENERKDNCVDLKGNIISNQPNGNAINFRTYLPFDYFDPYSNNQQDYNYDLSMDYGPVHICMPEITTQDFSSTDLSIGFIDMDLGVTNKEWKVLSFNFPLKSLNGDILNSTAYSTIRQKAINHNVQLVIMGHEDYYAHWVDNGIHFLILGNGGETTNGIDYQLINGDVDLVQASTVPHFAKFHIDGDLMYVDVIQGADYNGYTKGRTIEKFAIPKECVISNNQTWNTGDYPVITDYLFINNGVRLTVNSEIQILKDGDVRVNAGGTLKLSGVNAKITSVDAFTENIDIVTKDANGNITNSYKGNYTKQASYWDGIELKCNSQLDQLNFANQGVLIINDNATIENAKVGVAIRENQISLFGGGILKADKANFINNIVDIKMNPYQGIKTIGGGNIVKLSDRTRITRSSFTTNNDFLSTNASIKHIKLSGVRGVLLYGNTFDNLNTNLSAKEKGIGVFSSESSFRLTNTTNLFFNQTKANTFNNLDYGVKTYNSIANGATLIKGCTLTNTNSSIYLNESYSTSVLGNKISVPSYNTKAFTYPYGIYIDGGNGFIVENNDLSIGEEMPVTFGIIINGTGAYNNEIYNNKLTGFNVAIQPQDENFGFGIQLENLGLHLLCNEYSGMYDNWIAKSPNYFGAVGIAADQQMSLPNSSGPGTTNYPAGNKFSTTYRMAAYDYDNTDGNNPNGLYYYYDAGSQYNSEPTYISNVFTIARFNPNTCPDKSNSGNTPIRILTNYLENAQIALNSSRIILAIWQDGGNANLKEEVKTIQPWDVYLEFNHLIAESPYLSDEVLMATIQNPAFTSLMIKLIMVANPHASRNEEIMNMIYKRIPIMSKAYINEIKQGCKIESQLDLLKNDVSSNYHLVRMIGEDIKRNYRNDTINGNTIDNIYTFVSNQNDLLDKYEWLYLKTMLSKIFCKLQKFY